MYSVIPQTNTCWRKVRDDLTESYNRKDENNVKVKDKHEVPNTSSIQVVTDSFYCKVQITFIGEY